MLIYLLWLFIYFVYLSDLVAVCLKSGMWKTLPMQLIPRSVVSCSRMPSLTSPQYFRIVCTESWRLTENKALHHSAQRCQNRTLPATIKITSFPKRHFQRRYNYLKLLVTKDKLLHCLHQPWACQAYLITDLRHLIPHQQTFILEFWGNVYAK